MKLATAYVSPGLNPLISVLFRCKLLIRYIAEPLSRPTISTPPLGHLSGQAQVDAPAEARKRAQASILRLWPLEVRFQDYLDEGIDANIVRDLFNGLGLDTKTNKAPVEPPTAAKSHDIQPAAIDDHAPSVPKPTPVVVAPVSTSKAPVTTTSQKQEERKDRIARLLAAKNAKQQDLSGGSRPAATSNDTTASSTTRTSPQQAGQQEASEISRDKAAKKTEKERLLQLKLEALQKSRALRAQKATEREAAVQTSVPDVVPDTSNQGPAGPSPSVPNALARQTKEPDPRPESPNSSQAAPALSSIPGLFLSDTGSNHPRKRPTASDLNENSTAPPFKRAFNQHNVEKPLVIDVSDDSDDEDVEMEIGSQADDLPPESNHPNNLHQGRLSHLRDRPLPADIPNQHGLASPASGSEYAGPPRQADCVELQRINQHIDEMKRKIAEAERRKRAKAAPKDPSAQSQTPPEGSNTPAALQHPVSRPSSAQSHSPNPPGLLPIKPPQAKEGEVQKILPKVRHVPAADSQRGQRLRVVSDSLPTLESTIRARTAKLRLLRSQVARIEREVDDMLAEKAKLASELASLTEGNTWTEDASLAPKDASSSSSDQPSPQYATQIFDADNDAAPPGLNHISHTSANIQSAPRTGTLVLSKSSSSSVAQSGTSSGSHVGAVNGAPSGATSEPRDAPVDAPEDLLMPDAPTAGAPEVLTTPSPQSHPAPSPGGITIENAGQQAQGPGASEIEEHVTQVKALHAPKQTHPLPAKPGIQEAVPLSVSTHISNAAAHSNEESPEPTTEIHIAPSRLTTPGFVPYQSVLKEFLSYRFHPNFDKDVSQGLRSLTYSNKINSTLPFCLDSLSPEGCHKGAACEFQHADAIDIPGK